MIRRFAWFNWNVAAPLLVTIILAFTGYYYTYHHDLTLANRKAQLERVDHQLKDLYGPLYALSSANTRTWDEFREQYRPGKPFWDKNPPPTQEEAAAWRLWIKEVFMPLNLEMESLLLRHADLLVESEVPKVLLDLSAHIAGYKPVLKSWDQGDFRKNVSLFNFPDDLAKYAEASYRSLKAKQAKLLGELELK